MYFDALCSDSSRGGILHLCGGVWWLMIVGVIGAELFYFFGLFQFGPMNVSALPWPLIIG
jgi:hypothetical protein